MIVFAWDDWNADHLLKHHVTTDEAEYVVRHARAPFPREIGDDKHLVWGPTQDRRLLEVIFVYQSDEEVEYESLKLEDAIALTEHHATVAYVIHAMDLTPRMKRRYRRL